MSYNNGIIQRNTLFLSSRTFCLLSLAPFLIPKSEKGLICISQVQYKISIPRAQIAPIITILYIQIFFIKFIYQSFFYKFYYFLFYTIFYIYKIYIFIGRIHLFLFRLMKRKRWILLYFFFPL